MTTTPCPKTAPKLSATEKKLLQQIQAQAKPLPAWARFLSNTVCGFAY